MKKRTFRLMLILLALAMASTTMDAQFGGGGGGRPRGPRTAASPFMAGAELKIRKLNQNSKIDLTERDIIEVQLIYYRDCQTSAGERSATNTTGYTSPPVSDSQIICFYSVKACEYMTAALHYNVDRSDKDATPLCPYDPAYTYCDTDIISAKILNPNPEPLPRKFLDSNPPVDEGYRIEFYNDTIELPATSDDWVFGLLYTSDANRAVGDRRIWYTSKYHPKGQHCTQLQHSAPPGSPNRGGLIHTLGNLPPPAPPASPFTCRVSSLNTASSQNDYTEGFFYIEATYSNKLPDGFYPGTIIPRYKANTTPSSAGSPLIFQCKGIQRQYDLGYYDEEGHTLEFFKSTPFKYCCFGDPVCGTVDRTLAKLTYANGASEDNPLAINIEGGTSSMYSLDQNTGIVDMRADGKTGKYKTGFKVRERLKQPPFDIISETYRDIVLTIKNDDNECPRSNSISNNSDYILNPGGGIKLNYLVNAAIDNTRANTVEACAEQTIKFGLDAVMFGNTPGVLELVTEMTEYMWLTGATSVDVNKRIHPGPKTDTTGHQVTWNVPANAPPGIYPVIFQVKDCVLGYILTKTYVVNLKINKPAQIAWSYIGFEQESTRELMKLDKLSNRTYSCSNNLPIVLFAIGELGSTYTFKNLHPSLSADSMVDDFFQPTLISGDTICVEMTSSQYCQNKDTICIYPKAPISPTLDLVLPNTCFGARGKLEVKGVPPINGILYDWQNTLSEYDPKPFYLSNTASIRISQPTNIFKVFVITPDTCISPLSIDITSTGIIPKAKFTTDKQYVCPNDTIKVAPEVTTSICGRSSYSIPIGPTKFVTFDGSLSNTNTNPKIFTTTTAIDRGRTQLLYKAKELEKKGFKPGLISSVAFFIDGVSDPNVYRNISLHVKCTDKIDLANRTFENTSDMIKLGDYNSINLITGQWVTFNFSSNFTWDGETNLLFDVFTTCNSNCSQPAAVPPSFGDHLTNYVSVIGQYGKGQVSYETGNVTFTNLRHNIRFGYRDLDETKVKYSWKDVTSRIDTTKQHPKTVYSDTIANPKIVSDIPRTYEVTVENGNCKTITNVNALIDTNYKITINPSEVFKCPGDTVHVNAKKSYLTARPIIIRCGKDIEKADSCRVSDLLLYPKLGNLTSGTGTAIQSPFGGTVNAAVSASTDKRIQLMYTYNELKANSEMHAGYINRIAFDVTNKFPANNSKLSNFSVRLRCISNGLDSFVTDNFYPIDTFFKEVFFADEYTTIFGVNGIDLQTKFPWDGTQGILVDICFDNQVGSSYNGDVVRSSTLTRKRALIRSTNIGADFGCSFLTGTRDFIRPNIEFTICKPTRTPPPIPDNVFWAPEVFISNTQVTNPKLYNQSTGTYYIILNYRDTTYGKSNVVCRVRDTFISNVSRPLVEFNPKLVAACQGSQVKIEATVKGMNQNLYTYTWDTLKSFGLVNANLKNPKQTITPPNPGYYYVTVASKSNPNCFSIDSVYVDIQLPTTMPDLGGAALICPGDSVLLSIPTSLGYRNPLWKFNGNDLDTGYSLMVGKVGNYSILVDSGACRNASGTKVVSYRAQQTVRLTQPNLTICEGDTTILKYNINQNVANVLWNTGDASVETKVTQGGIYYLIKPRDQYGCIMLNPDTITIKLHSNPEFTIPNGTICTSSNGKITLSPVPYDPSSKYTWSPANKTAPSLDVMLADTIICVRTRGSCIKSAMSIISNDTPKRIDLGPDKGICCDELVALDANPEGKSIYSTYKWSTGEKSQVAITSVDKSGLYWVEAIKPNGCKDTGSIFIKALCTKATASVERPKIYLGQNNNLNAVHNQINATRITYEWVGTDTINSVLDPKKKNAIAYPLDTGYVEYMFIMKVYDTVYLKNGKYCLENAAVGFLVDSNGVDTVNAFTPNGDGINDYFYPGITGIVSLKVFKVYNRNGQLLHNDPLTPWNGKYNNVDQPTGVYMGLMTFEYQEPRKPMTVKTSRINITLIR